MNTYSMRMYSNMQVGTVKYPPALSFPSPAVFPRPLYALQKPLHSLVQPVFAAQIFAKS